MTKPAIKPDQKPIIAICSSTTFYKQAVDAQDELGALGFDVIIPSVATLMKESGDYVISHYQSWLANAADYPKKGALMRAHFAEIEKSDAILVLNYEKHGTPNYIGPNVLMEMSLAFWLNKPVFVLNELPENSAFEDELRAMSPIILHGNISALPELFEAL